MSAKTELVRKLCALCPAAAAEISQILAQYTIGYSVGGGKSNLKEKIAVFLDAKKIYGLSPKTLKNYREMLAAFASRVDKPVSKITTDDIREYIGYLSEERRLKDSSVQTHVNTLRSFFSWLGTEDIIRKNPMRRIKSRRIDPIRARCPLTPGQLEQVRGGCRTCKEKALVEFLVSSGCRLGEVVGIRMSDIDWETRSVPVLGKGGKTRTVFFSVRAKKQLLEYSAGRKGGDALFAASGSPYRPMTARAIQKALQAIGERSGVSRRIHPHILRHTFASSALNAGMDLAVIQSLLGHTDPKTTLIYAELLPQKIKQEYDRIAA